MSRSRLYETPSADVVEKVLYIALREETDALRNPVLPPGIRQGMLVHVQYLDGTLNLCAFPESKVPATSRYEKIWQRMGEQRAWYFRWMGDAIGPMLISRDLAAALKSQAAHVVYERQFCKTEPLDDLKAFLDKHLYVPRLAKAARAR